MFIMEKNNSLDNMFSGLMTNAAISTMLIGGMMNMLGTNEKIPKGVVKEMMEGVMDGLISHFGEIIGKLEMELKENKEQMQKILDENETLKDELSKVKKK